MSATDRPAGLSNLRYAVRILAGTSLDWLALVALGDGDPLWAMISTVVVLDPQLDATLLNFRSRFLHTLVGGAVGLALIALVPQAPFAMIPAGMAVSSLAATATRSLPGNWKIAPITCALVMAAGVASHSRNAALTTALRRTGEVVFGSAVAVAVTWVSMRVRRGPGRPAP
jgi:uncharacterized membrane protein YccC